MAEPSIQFGVSLTPFGAPTGWVPRGPARTVVKDRANVLNGIGNEVASQLYNERTEVTQEFAPASATVSQQSPLTIPPTIGAVLDEVVLTGISISTSATGFVSMTLTGHQHATNTHTNNLKQAAHGISLSKAFGSEDFMSATAGNNASLESSSVEITVQHIDLENGDGNHLVGENFDGRITFSQTWHGVPTTASGDAAITVTSTATNENNVGFLQTVVSGEKPLTLAEPA